MATRRFGISVGEGEFQVTEAVGAAVVADVVEVTVDIATTTVNKETGGGTRAITRDEVLQALQKIEAHILKQPWLPA